MANSGQNQFPLKKDAQDDTRQQDQQQGPASAGSQVRDEAKELRRNDNATD